MGQSALNSHDESQRSRRDDHGGFFCEPKELVEEEGVLRAADLLR